MKLISKCLYLLRKNKFFEIKTNDNIINYPKNIFGHIMISSDQVYIILVLDFY
jgi:hypothetical protein